MVDEFVTFGTMYRELSMEKHELNTRDGHSVRISSSIVGRIND